MVDATLTAIGRQLAAGGEVRITGFGNFKTQKRPARTGRNPQTGEPLMIEEKVLPKFAPGKTLKDAVSEGNELFSIGDTTTDP